MLPSSRPQIHNYPTEPEVSCGMKCCAVMFILILLGSLVMTIVSFVNVVQGQPDVWRIVLIVSVIVFAIFSVCCCCIYCKKKVMFKGD